MTPAELKATRASLYLTQADLANRIGLSTAAIAKYEGGTRPIPAIVVVALRTVTGEKVT